MNYSEFVGGLAKPGSEILAQMRPHDAHVLHMAVGVAGEAGELLDAVKKTAIYRKPLDMDNLVEELGDIEFFLQGLRDAYGLQREEIIAKNMEKLMKRYPQGYSNKAAQERADKA